MSRKPRNIKAGYSYHITIRCNNREFKLSRRECREVFLYAIYQGFKFIQQTLYILKPLAIRKMPPAPVRDTRLYRQNPPIPLERYANVG